MKRVGRMATAEDAHKTAVARITGLKWPRWPYLPMKRGPQNADLGFLYADYASDEDGVKLYRCNLLKFHDMSIEEREKVEVIDYPTVEALLADGWRID